MKKHSILDELTIRETNLMSQVHNFQGTIDEKLEQVEESGIIDQYKIIHSEYTSISSYEDEGLESLKRALYIQWIACCEPAQFTGISEIEKESEIKVFEKLDDLIYCNSLDSELQVMLTHYYAIANYYFDDYSNYINLYKFFKDKIEIEQLIEKAQFKDSQFKNRGSMGCYWESLDL